MVYDLLGLATNEDPEVRPREMDKLLSEMTWTASQAFEGGNFPAAELVYREILKAFPEDCLARFMITACAGAHRSDLAHVPEA